MKTIAVASGKGGVGKTTLTANLGVALAQAGQRVVLFDADLGLANLDIALGMKSEINLQHVIEGVVRMHEAASPSSYGVRVVTGSSGISSMLRLSRKRLEALLSQTTEFAQNTDVLIFDVASGADARVMTFLKTADQTILVTTPDPASIVDCYSTAKVLFRYKKDAVVNIVVNRTEDENQAQKAFETIELATQKFLHKTVNYLGYVRNDSEAAEIIRTRKPFVLTAGHLQVSRDVRTVAGAIMKSCSMPQRLHGHREAA